MLRVKRLHFEQIYLHKLLWGTEHGSTFELLLLLLCFTLLHFVRSLLEWMDGRSKQIESEGLRFNKGIHCHLACNYFIVLSIHPHFASWAAVNSETTAVYFKGLY